MSTTEATKEEKLCDEECFRRLNILDAKASALLRLCSMVTLLVTLIGLESNNSYASKAIRLTSDMVFGMRELLVLFGVTAGFFVFAMFCMIPILHVKFLKDGYEELVRKRMASYLVGYWSCIGGMVSLAVVLFLVFLQHYQK